MLQQQHVYSFSLQVKAGVIPPRAGLACFKSGILCAIALQLTRKHTHPLSHAQGNKSGAGYNLQAAIFGFKHDESSMMNQTHLSALTVLAHCYQFSTPFYRSTLLSTVTQHRQTGMTTILSVHTHKPEPWHLYLMAENYGQCMIF